MIHIFTTGGTIAGLEYDASELRDKQVTIDLEDYLLNAKVSFEYDIDSVFSKDSRFITEHDRDLLAEKIKNCIATKILVTHGTLTMIETAKFLGKMNIEKTIVLVGAFILGTERNTDAPFNLGYAFSALQFLDSGVYIAMNGNVLDWKTVVKNGDKSSFENSPL